MNNLYRIVLWDSSDDFTEKDYDYWCYVCKKKIYNGTNPIIYEVTDVSSIIGNYGYTCSHDCAELLILRMRKGKK